VEAVPEASPKPERNPFEGVDLREAGRKGGKASGVSRRLRPLRELEAGIVESRNGAAKWKLLETRRRQLAELERARLLADERLLGLMDEADAERATIARLRERRREYEAAVTQRLAQLEARERLMIAAVKAAEGDLARRLRDLDDDSIACLLRAAGLEYLETEAD
jgi:hypothetical protein